MQSAAASATAIEIAGMRYISFFILSLSYDPDRVALADEPRHGHRADRARAAREEDFYPILLSTYGSTIMPSSPHPLPRRAPARTSRG